MPDEDPKPDVLSSLPRTRPQRRSTKRDAGAKPAPKQAASNGSASAAKPAAKAANGPRAKAASKPRAKAAAKPTAKPAAKSATKPRAATPKERRIPPAGFEAPRDKDERPLPSGAELIGTAFQAAGELAQIGIAVGGQALKSVLRRGR